jgi:hypothetical protein
MKTEISINHINLRNFGTSSGHSTIILYFFRLATKGWPFFCLFRPFMIFEGYLNSNTECCRCAITLATHPSTVVQFHLFPSFKLLNCTCPLKGVPCCRKMFLCALILVFWSGTCKLSLFLYLNLFGKCGRNSGIEHLKVKRKLQKKIERKYYYDASSPSAWCLEGFKV